MNSGKDDIKTDHKAIMLWRCDVDSDNLTALRFCCGGLRVTF